MKAVLQLPVLVAVVAAQEEEVVVVVVVAVEVLAAHCLQRLPKQKGRSLPLQKRRLG